MYKFAVFAPRDKELIRKIIDVASKEGAGKIGKYNGCAFITEGVGTWTADLDANPHLGEVGKIEEIEEVKIEMQCPDDSIEKVVKAIKEIHPYEEVVIDVYRIE